MTQDTAYTIEEGIESPRDGSVNWRSFAVYSSKSEAMRELRKLPKGFWRLLESRIVWEGVS